MPTKSINHVVLTGRRKKAQDEAFAQLNGLLSSSNKGAQDVAKEYITYVLSGDKNVLSAGALTAKLAEVVVEAVVLGVHQAYDTGSVLASADLDGVRTRLAVLAPGQKNLLRG